MNAPAAAIPQVAAGKRSRLPPLTIEGIREGLSLFARLSRADEAVLLGPAGAVLVRWDGADQRADLDALAALAVAACAATQAVAQRLGDNSFGGICHQGSQNSLYVAPLIRGYLLLTLHRSGSDMEAVRRVLGDMLPRLNAQLVPQDPTPLESCS